MRAGGLRELVVQTVTLLWRRHWPIVCLLALWLLLALLRCVLTQQSVLMHSDCNACLAWTIVKHDALALLLLALLSAAAGGFGNRLVPLVMLLQLTVLMASAGDLIALANTGHRLRLADVAGLAEQPLIAPFLVSQRANVALWLTATILVTLWVAHWWGLLRRAADQHDDWQASRILAVIAFVAGAWWLAPQRFSHALPWSYQNLLQVNWPSGVDQPYSAEFAAKLGEVGVAAGATCQAGADRGQDVIVVQLGSWSWYHSGNLAGTTSLTPRLDELMDQYTWWSAFYSNGFTRDQTKIALLTGRDPLPAVNRYRSQSLFQGFEFAPDSLPRRLHADGYRLAYFGAANPDQRELEWLRSIDVDYINAPVEAQAAPGPTDDSDVYASFLQWLGNEHRVGMPFFALLETVTTRPPMRDPVSGQIDEAAAFRFADEALLDFYRTLDRVDYFDRGILLVTANQRALTPLRRAELAQFGASAAARVPLLAIGNDFAGHGRVDVPAQMRDLGPSLDRLLTGQSCAPASAGDMFASPPSAPRCILHVQGNRRAVLQVFCADDYGEVLLDGDGTRVLRGEIADGAQLIDRINRQRIKAGELTPDLERIQ